MTSSPVQRLPEELSVEGENDTERLLGKCSLVLGAPKLGKSHWFDTERFANHSDVKIVRDLEQGVAIDPAYFVVVDEFYRA